MGRIIDRIQKKDFLDMYLSGKSFSDIAEIIGINKVYVKRFFRENFWANERLELNKQRAKNINKGEVK